MLKQTLYNYNYIMPSFKPKNIKKIVISKKNITTIDTKHKEITQEFKVLKEESLPALTIERKRLKRILKKSP